MMKGAVGRGGIISIQQLRPHIDEMQMNVKVEK